MASHIILFMHLQTVNGSNPGGIYVEFSLNREGSGIMRVICKFTNN